MRAFVYYFSCNQIFSSLKVLARKITEVMDLTEVQKGDQEGYSRKKDEQELFQRLKEYWKKRKILVTCRTILLSQPTDGSKRKT